METSGDTTLYRAVSDGCEGCDNLADTVERYYAAGGYIEWNGWEVLSVRPQRGRDDSFVMTVESTPTEYKESAGGPIKRLSGGQSQYVFELREEGASWVVLDKDELVS